MDQVCNACGSTAGFSDIGDGLLYCDDCNTQVEGLVDECIDEHDLFLESAIYSQKRARPTPAKARALSLSQQFDQKGVKFDDGVGPLGPSDFGMCQVEGSYESYYLTIRKKYVMGFQIILQIQTKALVEHFNVSSSIIDLHNPIWLRLLARTGVMADDWADKVLQVSEINDQGEVTESQRSARHREEPQNLFGQRAVMIWFRSLRSCLPISYTLALSFLFCHVAEEPILPTDILKGVLEGKIPYFSAFVDIEEQLGPHNTSCPIPCSVMFRAAHVVSLQKLEVMATCIAQKIGLELRPLNFNALATRYMEELSLPVSKILPLASCIYQWCVPQGIYLSVDESKLPSRVCLMSILVVAIRIYYNINGFGKWESTMSNSSNSFPRDKLKGKKKFTFGSDIGTDALDEDFITDISSKDSDVVELLHTLDGKFEKLCELHDTFVQYKDLPSYLQFCNDGVFAGVEPSFKYYEEEEMVNDLREFYQKHQKDSEPSEEGTVRARKDEVCTPIDNKSVQGDGITCDTVQREKSECSEKTSDCFGTEDIVQETPLKVSSREDRAIRSVKRDMEDNKFVYIPPRSNIKKDDHIYYSRKKSNGAFVYAVHGDYYILLRSCAKACQVDVRTMHIGVLSFERRLRKREREHVDSKVENTDIR